jgi:arylsulfatase A-like enzyme
VNELSRRTFLKSAVAAGVLPAAGTGRLLAAGDRPNVISICCDTWSAHWVGAYGNQQIRTPNVDALAARSAVFQQAFAEALPTVPARRAIYTGRRVFPSRMVLQQGDANRIRGWHQLYLEDVTLAESMRDAGYTTALVSDLLHQFRPGMNFHRGFMGWRWIRGQEGDSYETGPTKDIDPAKYLHPSQPGGAGGPPPRPGGPGGPPPLIKQYLTNRQYWKTEDDWPCARLFREAGQWLDDNVEDSQPFFLQIECYSPHEMWDPPEDYYRLYMKSDYSGPRLISPPVFTRNLSAVEFEHVRALYNGMITFTDTHIGKFLEKVEKTGLMNNTIILFYADHGCMMGEQGQLRKDEGLIRTQVTRVPLILYDPRESWNGRRIGGLVQDTDIMPTLLDMIGSQVPSRVTGESLRPLASSGGPSRREWIVSGWGDHGAIRTPEWLYIGRWNPGETFEDIYDLKADPLELKNIAPEKPDLVKDFRARLKEYVDSGWSVTDGTFVRVLSEQG